MNAQMTFDTLHPSDPRAVIARARNTDPETSHEAAARVSPGCKECVDAIRLVVWVYLEPITAFQIAYLVDVAQPNRWDEGTIRRRVKDARLTFVDKEGKSPRGGKCKRFTL